MSGSVSKSGPAQGPQHPSVHSESDRIVEAGSSSSSSSGVSVARASGVTDGLWSQLAQAFLKSNESGNDLTQEEAGLIEQAIYNDYNTKQPYLSWVRSEVLQDHEAIQVLLNVILANSPADRIASLIKAVFQSTVLIEKAYSIMHSQLL